MKWLNADEYATAQQIGIIIAVIAVLLYGLVLLLATFFGRFV